MLTRGDGNELFKSGFCFKFIMYEDINRISLKLILLFFRLWRLLLESAWKYDFRDKSTSERTKNFHRFRVCKMSSLWYLSFIFKLQENLKYFEPTKTRLNVVKLLDVLNYLSINYKILLTTSGFLVLDVSHNSGAPSARQYRKKHQI